MDTNAVSDVLIVGSGISGTLTATVLGRAGFKVGLIDRHEVYPRDFRAEHLAGAVIELLARLNVLGGLTHNLFRGETVTFARYGPGFGTTNFGLRYETLANRARAALPPNVQVVTGRMMNVATSKTRQQVCLMDGGTFEGLRWNLQRSRVHLVERVQARRNRMAMAGHRPVTQHDADAPLAAG